MIPFLGPIIATIVGAVASVAAKAAYDKAVKKPEPARCPKCMQRDTALKLTCCNTLICEECSRGFRARGTCEYCGAGIVP